MENACGLCGIELGRHYPFSCCDECWVDYPTATRVFRRDGSRIDGTPRDDPREQLALDVWHGRPPDPA